MGNLQIKRFVASGLLAILTLILLYPYWVTLVWAAIFAIILYPIHIYLQTRYIPKKYSVLVVVTSFAILILVPILLFASYQLLALANYLSNPENITKLTATTNSAISNLPFIGRYITINQVNLESLLKESFKPENIQNYIPIIKYTGATFLSLFIQIFLLIIILYQFLKYAKEIHKFAHKVLFRGFKTKEELLDSLVVSTRQISLNILLVGFTSGIIMGIIYYFLGLPAPAVLAILTGIVAVIPFMLPIFYAVIALVLLFNKLFISAVIILVVGLFINFIADNIVQPKLLERKANLNFAASVLGIIAGVEMLGPVGIFLGPIIFNLVLNFVILSYKL